MDQRSPQISDLSIVFLSFFVHWLLENLSLDYATIFLEGSGQLDTFIRHLRNARHVMGFFLRKIPFNRQLENFRSTSVSVSNDIPILCFSL